MQTKQLNKSELFKILLIGVLSFVAIFGIYNTFTINLVHILNGIEVPKEKYANYFILIVTMVTMITLQGINFRKKHLMEKMSTILILILIVATILATIFFFTSTIVYPLLSLLIVGLTTYLLDLAFMTLGVRGFFFFILGLSFAVLAFYKLGFHSSTFLINMGQVVLALILFLGATYPRIKKDLFKIAVRDNIDISNSGSEDSENHEDSHHND